MEFALTAYSLPDYEIFKQPLSDYEFSLWQPDQTYLILGQSNTAENSLYLDKVLIDNVVVMKRPSGGETVILTPKTLVISAVYINHETKNAHAFFRIFNNLIINGLTQSGIQNVSHKGISDLAIGEKKILGSSIYSKREKVFYHAVLNVAESVECINKYIRHPKREPDYRKGRNHNEFVTSIMQHYPDITMQKLMESLKRSMQEFNYSEIDKNY
jgi:lipoate-protein ligase A